MSWLTLNGIETSRIAAIDGAPTGEHRDIGGKHEAADGSLAITRQVRKRDVKFETVPLAGAAAFSWESLLTGEGHVWPFNNSYYSSKGLAPSVIDTGGFETTTPSPKYGSHYLELEIDDTLTFDLPYGSIFTVSVWAQNPTVLGDSNWHHFVNIASLGWWVDGAFVGPAPTLPFNSSFGPTQFTFIGPDPGPCNIDDLVICPYEWLEDWPAQVYADTKAFGLNPVLTAAGLLVPEAATRDMLCTAVTERLMKANLSDGEGMAPDVRVLSVELKAR